MFSSVANLCKSCVTFNKEKHTKRINVIIFDNSYKNFVLFKHDNIFDCYFEKCDENLTENNQIRKILSNLYQNDCFVVDFESTIVKKNIFSMFYCTANNIDKIKNGKIVEINSINENGYFVEGNEVSTFLMVNLERIKRYTTIKCLSN